MKVSFKSLMWGISRGVREIEEVSTAGVYIKKEDRNTSDQLNLSKSVRDGGNDKFTLFESNGKIGSDVKLYTMCIRRSKPCQRLYYSLTGNKNRRHAFSLGS